MKKVKFFMYNCILRCLWRDPDVPLTGKQKSQLRSMWEYTTNYDYLKQNGIL